MSDVKQTNTNTGIGFFGLLTVLFIGLKLTHVIDWPWFLVLVPILGPILVFVAILLVMALVVGIVKLCS